MFGGGSLPVPRLAACVLMLAGLAVLHSQVSLLAGVIVAMVAVALVLKRRYAELLLVIAVVLFLLWLSAVCFELFLATEVLHCHLPSQVKGGGHGG